MDLVGWEIYISPVSVFCIEYIPIVHYYGIYSSQVELCFWFRLMDTSGHDETAMILVDFLLPAVYVNWVKVEWSWAMYMDIIKRQEQVFELVSSSFRKQNHGIL